MFHPTMHIPSHLCYSAVRRKEEKEEEIRVSSASLYSTIHIEIFKQLSYHNCLMNSRSIYFYLSTPNFIGKPHEFSCTPVLTVLYKPVTSASKR